MRKNIFFIFYVILVVILIIIFLPDISKEQQSVSPERIKFLKKEALVENNKTAAEELIFINAINNKEKAKFWVDIVSKIENKN